MNNLIIVNTKENPSILKLIELSDSKLLLSTEAFLGRNGTTSIKYEGDGKTPLRRI